VEWSDNVTRDLHHIFGLRSETDMSKIEQLEEAMHHIWELAIGAMASLDIGDPIEVNTRLVEIRNLGAKHSFGQVRP
jgi:hypothetical protein